ncbi:MAG: dihydroxyacetone kinase phosphoryl donor subunit DhaM [Egibacteraceae bacterium]
MVGIVLVSHSAALVEGLRELVAQMADDVAIVGAGGDDEGGLGTSMEAVTDAIAQADSGEGVLILYDLGSAEMSAEMATELLDDEQRKRTRIVDAPLVEGALAAATTVSADASLDDVAQAALAAGVAFAERAAGEVDARTDGDSDDEGGEHVEETFELPGKLGLHARPAALIARSQRDLDAQLRVALLDDEGGVESEADGGSTLGLVALGAEGGRTIRLRASGPDRSEAVRRVSELIHDGFGESE